MTLATAGQWLSSFSNRGKGHLHQFIHACNQQTNLVCWLFKILVLNIYNLLYMCLRIYSHVSNVYM